MVAQMTFSAAAFKMPLGPEFLFLKSSQVVGRTKPNADPGADDFGPVTFLIGWVQCSNISTSGRGGGSDFDKKSPKLRKLRDTSPYSPHSCAMVAASIFNGFRTFCACFSVCTITRACAGRIYRFAKLTCTQDSGRGRYPQRTGARRRWVARRPRE